ncbi:MAG TPA: response regulator transcription factor [Pirellulaceae bacterium]|nr:response regulator transcription factor [Pirellulaceae bacterium]
MTIRVLLADDQPVVRTGIVAMLEGSDVKVIAEASTGNQAIEQAVKHHPDVVLLEVRLPETDGLEAMERILERSPRTKVVIFSSTDLQSYVARSVALGAAGYLLKSASREELLAAIRRAHAGLPPDPDGLMGRIKNTMVKRRPTYDDEIPLTNREVQILRHVALGLANREIGKSLDISVETVKEHMQNILRKLEANDRTQAAVWAVKKGLV